MTDALLFRLGLGRRLRLSSPVARAVAGGHLAAAAFAAAVAHATAAVLFTALFAAGAERLLLLRAHQVLHFFLCLLVKLADLFLLLLGAQRGVRANRLHLGTGIFFDLMMLLKGRLRNTGDLPAGLLALAAAASGSIGSGVAGAGSGGRRGGASRDSSSRLCEAGQGSDEEQNDSETKGPGVLHGEPPLRPNPGR